MQPKVDESARTSLVSGVLLALIVVVSICFYVPLIIDSLREMRETGDGVANLLCASGLELCQVLLLVVARSGFQG